MQQLVTFSRLVYSGNLENIELAYNLAKGQGHAELAEIADIQYAEQWAKDTAATAYYSRRVLAERVQELWQMGLGSRISIIQKYGSWIKDVTYETIRDGIQVSLAFQFRIEPKLLQIIKLV